jgi:hypothetical protein
VAHTAADAAPAKSPSEHHLRSRSAPAECAGVRTQGVGHACRRNSGLATGGSCALCRGRGTGVTVPTDERRTPVNGRRRPAPARTSGLGPVASGVVTGSFRFLREATGTGGDERPNCHAACDMVDEVLMRARRRQAGPRAFGSWGRSLSLWPMGQSASRGWRPARRARTAWPGTGSRRRAAPRRDRRRCCGRW